MMTGARWTTGLAICALVACLACHDRVVVGHELPLPAPGDVSEDVESTAEDAGSASDDPASDDAAEDPAVVEGVDSVDSVDSIDDSVGEEMSDDAGAESPSGA